MATEVAVSYEYFLGLCDDPPEAVVKKTLDILMGKGWCVWRCRGLDDDALVVVLDENVTGYPAGLPVYTLKEMELVGAMDLPAIRLAHTAKKTVGAVITGGGKND